MPALPYLTSPGNVSKAFSAIQAAATPPKVSQDFVKTVLKIPGGSGDNMTTFLKRIGFAASDGTPTERYKQFRNPKTSRAAVAQAMRDAYSEVFKRNEFANLLSDEEVKGHIVEITGNAADARNVTLTVSTFMNMEDFADFSDKPDAAIEEHRSNRVPASPGEPDMQASAGIREVERRMGLNIGYTINLNLPATSDIAVFNAIFKSLKQNLLNDDG